MSALLRACSTTLATFTLASIVACNGASTSSPETSDTAEAAATGPREVSGSEAVKLVADGATLLDVRTVEEFEEGHVDGAINIPVDDLAARQGELSKDTPVVVYCRSGRRSNRAAELLHESGFEVADLGPMSAWPDE